MGAKKRKIEESKAPEAPPAPKLSEEETIILDYMTQQNRPYSAINVADNIRGAVKKAQVPKVLDSLAEQGLVQAKDFGKARVYLVDQKNLPSSTDEELAVLDSEIKEKQEAVDLVSEEVKELKEQLKSRGKLMDIAQLRQEIAQLTKLSETQQKELEDSQGVTPVTDEERVAMEKKLGQLKLATKGRQKLCMNILNSLSEMMDLRLSEVITKMGIELP